MKILQLKTLLNKTVHSRLKSLTVIVVLLSIVVSNALTTSEEYEEEQEEEEEEEATRHEEDEPILYHEDDITEAPKTPEREKFLKGIQSHGIYHSLQSILETLDRDEYREKTEVRQLISSYQNDCSDGKIEVPPSYNKTGLWPFIVVEGVQTSGKLTVSRRVTEILQADFLTTPPDCLFHLRPTFEALNGTLRSLYYSLCMYALANQAMKRLRVRAVVANRYWHSQAAFGLAVAEISDNMQLPPDSVLYKWPDDLLKPDLAFYLQYSHSKSRLKAPSNVRAMTRKFRDRMSIHMNRMREPVVFEVFETTVYPQIRAVVNYVVKKFANKFPKAPVFISSLRKMAIHLTRMREPALYEVFEQRSYQQIGRLLKMVEQKYPNKFPFITTKELTFRKPF